MRIFARLKPKILSHGQTCRHHWNGHVAGKAGAETHFFAGGVEDDAGFSGIQGVAHLIQGGSQARPDAHSSDDGRPD